ncbi:UNVERIFIED_CONTAM: hypothetical protein Cloal_2516 [Acetivibrio alkalicellulosi]
MFFLIFSLVMLCMAFFLIILMSLLSNTGNKNIHVSINKKSKQNYASKVYKKLSTTPLIGKYLERVKGKLYYAQPSYDESQLRSKTIVIVFLSFSVSIFACILFFNLYGRDFYTRLTMLVLCVFLNNIMLERLIGNKRDKLLNYLPESINDLKQQYHLFKMVDIAIYEAAKKAKPEMSPKLYEIYNILKSSNPKEKLSLYYTNCKDKFLKILAGFSYLVIEYGDKEINGTSLYIKNLNHIMEEINNEKIKRMKLNFYLKSLPLVSVIPIFFPPLLSYWVKSNFAAAASFYDSSLAFFIRNLILFTIFICYILITQFKEETDVGAKKESEKIWEYKALKKPFIKRFVDLFVPGKKSVKRLKLKLLIEESGTYLNEHCIYLQRIIAATASFFIIISLFYYAHIINKNAIMSNANYGLENNNIFAMVGNLSEEDVMNMAEINKFDAKVVALFQSTKLKGDELKESIAKEIRSLGINEREVMFYAERIKRKIEDTNNENMNLLELIIALAGSWMFSYLPIGFLYFKKGIRMSEIQDEIFQFHTIIILLMHHKNTSVKVVLEWLVQFSNYFKGILVKCLNNFHDPESALNDLKKDAKNKDFQNIVDNLLMATNKLDINEAFDSLEIDREFYKDNRKVLNEQMVLKKVSIGKSIAFIPLWMTLLLYLVLPLILTSLTGMVEMFEAISTI